MVTALLAGLLASVAPQQGEPPTFSDAETAELYARARVRHVRQDSLVRDYRAEVETRIDFTAGKSRFARQTALMASETRARITWRVPNDLKIEVLGTRAAAPVLRMVAGMGVSAEDISEAERDFGQEIPFDRPWFIPRSMGDSVHLMGLPEHAALHPLATDATDHYRFSITDSVRITVPGREVRAVKMRVEPKHLGPSLVAGDMWIDWDTGDVVRLMVVFVGEFMWEQVDGNTPEDSAEAREGNKWARRFLSVEADIEYALIENRFWLPHRQLLVLTVRIPWFFNSTMPVRFASSFRNYEVNTQPQLQFAVPIDEDDDPDRARTKRRLRISAGRAATEQGTREARIRDGYFRTNNWANGRWEIEVPPVDTLLSSPWDEEFKLEFDRREQLRFREALVDLAELSEGLPSQWVGRLQHGVAWERFSDIVRFNRVQGMSLGMGYQVRFGLDFTTLHATARFGLGDLRPTASVVWRRDGPAGRLDIALHRAVYEVEPWTGGQSAGNSMNATFTGHDYADYHLALGGSITYLWNTGPLRDVEVTAGAERHRSMSTRVDAPVPKLFGAGQFQPNPPVSGGIFYRAGLLRPFRLGAASMLGGADLLGNDSLRSARVWGRASIPLRFFRRTGTLTLRAGTSSGDPLPQLAFRLGGTHTVRGFDYGTRVGRDFWSAQVDMAMTRSSVFSPVVFFDIGDTFSNDPMMGAGAGISLINGLLRFNLSKGMRPETAVRFDLRFSASR